MARPKVERHPISLRLPTALVVRLDRIAAGRGVSRSTLIEQGLAAVAEKYDPEGTNDGSV